MATDATAHSAPEVVAALTAHIARRHAAHITTAQATGTLTGSVCLVAASEYLTEANAAALYDVLVAAVADRATWAESTFADLAENPHTPAPVLVRIVTDGPRQAKEDAAGNPSTPLQVLLTTPGAAVWRSPHCPPALLTDFLTADRGEAYRTALRHPNLPTATLHALAADAERQQRRDLARAVAANPNTDHALYLRMRAVTAATRPGTEVAVMDRTRATHPLADPTWLADLVADSVDELDPLSAILVRSAAASNPRTPAAVLRTLLRHPAVNDVAAANPATPPDALTDALSTGSPVLRQAALTNPALHPAALEHIWCADVRSFAALAKRWARTPEQALAILAIGKSHPGTVADLLATTSAATTA